MDEQLRDESDEFQPQENGSAGAFVGFLVASLGLAVLVIA